MSLTEEAQKRGCYCDKWETNPAVFESLGYPRGYCGFCEVCGQPGHTQHFPGPIPYSGCWCDRHWRRMLWLDPRARFGCLVWIVGLALVWFVLKLLR